MVSENIFFRILCNCANGWIMKYYGLISYYLHRNHLWLFLLDDSEDEDDEIQMPRVSLFDRIRTNYFLNGSMFREAFRVDREVVVELEQHLGRYLQVSRRNNALDARQQILTTLHFLGNGAQYHVNGHMHTVSKSTVCRCVHRVCRLIATNLMPLFVRWPTTSRIVEAEFFNNPVFLM